jgi:hypothetical protein
LRLDPVILLFGERDRLANGSHVQPRLHRR